MKSKQLNFFLSPDDIESIDIFLKENNCMMVKKDVERPNVENWISLMDTVHHNVYTTYLTS